MPLSSTWYVPLAVLSGAGFAVLAISYRMGQPKGIAPIHIIVVCSLIGAAVLGVKSLASPWGEVPAWVLLAAVIVGASQYLIVLLAKAALQMGPVSALACILSMSFLPVSLYANRVFGERVAPLQYAAFPLAVISIVAASLSSRQQTSAARVATGKPKVSLRYGLVLVAILLVNTLPFVMIKELGTRKFASVPEQTYMARFGDIYFFTFYMVLAACTAAHLGIRRQFHPNVRAVLALGALAGLGSVIGILGLEACADGPTATVFTLNNVSTVVVTAIVSAIFFGEGRRLTWYATVICGVLAMVLAKLNEILN